MVRIKDILDNNLQCMEADRDFTPFPAIPNDLLQALNNAYPLELPNPDDSERDIWIKVGARRVVEFLLQRKAQELDEHVQ